jgi:hypothetical protein
MDYKQNNMDYKQKYLKYKKKYLELQIQIGAGIKEDLQKADFGTSFITDIEDSIKQKTLNKEQVKYIINLKNAGFTNQNYFTNIKNDLKDKKLTITQIINMIDLKKANIREEYVLKGAKELTGDINTGQIKNMIDIYVDLDLATVDSLKDYQNLGSNYAFKFANVGYDMITKEKMIKLKKAGYHSKFAYDYGDIDNNRIETFIKIKNADVDDKYAFDAEKNLTSEQINNMITLKEIKSTDKKKAIISDKYAYQSAKELTGNKDEGQIKNLINLIKNNPLYIDNIDEIQLINEIEKAKK